MNPRFNNWTFPEISDGIPTKYNWVVQHVDQFKLERFTDIGAFCYINAKFGVTIEEDVQIGSHCSIYSVSTIDGKTGPVHLKKNCRIGSHSVVMPGVTIGENAVVGAMSFVNCDIPDNVVAVGTPAKIIRRLSVEDNASMQKQRVFLSPPHMSGEEQAFVAEAFASNYIAPLGPQVDAFEKEFCELVGARHAVALTSGTAAMHLALKHIGVKPGDEVFASTLTFIGSVSPVTFEGGVPVFIDCDRVSWNMDPDLLEAELARSAAAGRLPAAVIPTDLYGQCADYDRIYKVCEQYGVPVIVDAAEALGARYLGKSGERHAGAGARAAVFSFNGNKIITSSGGGMLVSNDKALIDHARFLSQQARDPFPHYEHTEIGYNYRMSNVVAAIGRGQLRVLEERVRRKREIFDFYHQALSDLPGMAFMPEAAYGRCTRWLTVILIDPETFGAHREDVRLALEAENIESRPVWKPMHLQPVFQINGGNGPAADAKKRYLARAIGGAVSAELFERGLCLPSGTAMTNGDLERVAAVIRKCCAAR